MSTHYCRNEYCSCTGLWLNTAEQPRSSFGIHAGGFGFLRLIHNTAGGKRAHKSQREELDIEALNRFVSGNE